MLTGIPFFWKLPLIYYTSYTAVLVRRLLLCMIRVYDPWQIFRVDRQETTNTPVGLRRAQKGPPPPISAASAGPVRITPYVITRI